MKDPLFSPEYLKQIAELHENDKSWGTTGVAWAGRTIDLIRAVDAKSYLDYGCGKGYLVEAVARAVDPEFHLQAYDPARPEFAAPPAPADVVTCTDVLEHIEPDYLDAVLNHIAALTGKAALLVISCRKAKAVLSDGRNAHLIIREPIYWIDKISARFSSTESDFRDGPRELIIKAFK